MNIAVFGDVHGNRFELEAVVADIERHSLGIRVNLEAAPLRIGMAAADLYIRH